MHRVAVAQLVFINERQLEAVKLLVRSIYLFGVKSSLHLSKRVLIGFIEEVRIAPEMFPDLLFECGVETVVALTAEAGAVETITHVTRKQFVSSLPCQDHADAAITGDSRKRHRTNVERLLHRALA